ncbi:MAG: prepilin-type N-terminal cleavage/methylation domain-containing protein [Candidatus Saccharimonadales bacterium]
MTRLQRTRYVSGFTIVELLVVIVVIGMLAAITLMTYGGSQRHTAETVLQSDLKNAATLLSADNNFSNSYPATTAAADGGAGLPASVGTTYQYTYTAGTNSYFLTATTTARAGVGAFYITNTTTTPKPGACSGHTGG